MWRELLGLIYLTALLGLCIYAIHSALLLVLFLRHRRDPAPGDPCLDGHDLPRVTVQIPLRNERYAVAQILPAVFALEWPRDRFEVQVLDDSDDETGAIVRQSVERYRHEGYTASVIHRPASTGAKAGALAHGLMRAQADYLAIFDADFQPAPDFLLRTVPHLVEDPTLGAVQARWEHLNAQQSALTRAQSLLLDMHFTIDHVARNRSGLLMNFNGTAGVWRREAIASSGGWQSDTVCEDLDLSYRAQLKGWGMLYLPQVTAPAQLPVSMAAFRQQQQRWAKGAAQTLRKLAPSIVRSRQLKLRQKLMALLHLSGYFVQPLLLVMLLCSPAMALWPPDLPSWSSYLGGLLALPMLLVPASQVALHRDWTRWLRSYPLVLGLGAGLGCSLMTGLWEGLRHWGGVFQRTPKLPRHMGEQDVDEGYRAPNRLLVCEPMVFLYSLATLVLASVTGRPAYLGLALPYALGTGWVLAEWLSTLAKERRR